MKNGCAIKPVVVTCCPFSVHKFQRLISTVSGVATTYTYSYASTDNRLASISGGSSRTFTHDGAGNVTYDNRSGGGYGYSYNNANRMQDMSVNGVVQAEYVYNALGQQVIRRIPANREDIHSIHDLDGNRIAEYNFNASTGVTTLLREYVWLEGRAIAVIEGGVTSYIRTDHIGRPVFATDGVGAKVWEAQYLPFGGVDTTTGTPINLRFPGQWFQSESGLHQNWMRDYDPTTGRYIQADPLGLVDGASVYAYALQNPGRYVDPRGLGSITNESGSAIIVIDNSTGNHQILAPGDEVGSRIDNLLELLRIPVSDWDFVWKNCQCVKIGSAYTYTGPVNPKIVSVDPDAGDRVPDKWCTQHIPHESCYYCSSDF